MSLKIDLLELFSRLPATGTADGRKALLLCTGFAYLGLGLEFDGGSSTFFSRLLAELARRGPAALAAFLEAVLRSPYADRCRPELAELRDRAGMLDEAALAVELGAPADRPAAPDVSMLAATVVLQVLAPYYQSGAEGLRRPAGERAANLAVQVADTVETALGGDKQARCVLADFRQMPYREEDLVAELVHRLDGDPALAAELAELLSRNAEGLEALAQQGWGGGWFLSGAVAAVVGREAMEQIEHEVGSPEMAKAAIEEPSSGDRDLESMSFGVPQIEVTQTVGTVETGGTAVGTVTGPAVITGGGASIGGDAQVGGDLVGRDQVIQGDRVEGDKITVETGGHLTIVTGGAAAPATPLVEEKIRLDVAAPPSAELEKPFDLAVAVRQPGAPPLAVDDLTQVKSEEGSVFRHEQDEVVLYRVEVTAAGCDVLPPHYVLKLRPGGNSAPCWFQITPHRPGKQSILVTAYQEDDALAAQTRLSIEVLVPVVPVG